MKFRNEIISTFPPLEALHDSKSPLPREEEKEKKEYKNI